MQRIGAVHPLEAEVRLIKMCTARRVSTPTLATATAGLVRKHDVITALDALYPLTDGLDNARAFMPQHDGAIAVVPGVAHVNVGVADPACNDAHQGLVVSWPFQLESLDPQGAAPRAQNGGLNFVHWGAGLGNHC